MQASQATFTQSDGTAIMLAKDQIFSLLPGDLNPPLGAAPTTRIALNQRGLSPMCPYTDVPDGRFQDGGVEGIDFVTIKGVPADVSKAFSEAEAALAAESETEDNQA